ncbi:hypothetical protein D3C71_1863240 [compost metagenome]
MHGHARGLVDGQHMVIFEQLWEFTCRRRVGGLFRDLVGDAHRRQTHAVAFGHTRIGAGAAFVDAHLATADDAVNMGFGDALEMAYQEVIQALASGICVDCDEACSRGCDALGSVHRRFALYNVFHLRDTSVSG